MVDIQRGYLDELGRFISEELPSAPVGGTGAELVLRTQLSPEMRIDLAELGRGKPAERPEPKGLLAQGLDWVLSELVRPEIEIQVLGQSQTIAPWGKPEPERGAWLAVGGAALAAGVFWLGYQVLCRSRS
ncbi:MAG: hypothetical protein AB7G54_00570 [Methyloceanibacter sp.]